MRTPRCNTGRVAPASARRRTTAPSRASTTSTASAEPTGKERRAVRDASGALSLYRHQSFDLRRRAHATTVTEAMGSAVTIRPYEESDVPEMAAAAQESMAE